MAVIEKELGVDIKSIFFLDGRHAIHKIYTCERCIQYIHIHLLHIHATIDMQFLAGYVRRLR